MIVTLAGLVSHAGATYSAVTFVTLGKGVLVALGVISGLMAMIQLREFVAERRDRHKRDLADQGDHGPKALLPTRLPLLVDRTDALKKAAVDILAGGRLLAFEGAPGVGKSAVATEFAHRLKHGEVNGTPAFASCDFLWVDCRERQSILPDICRGLTLLTGDQSVSAVAADAKLDALRAHLARRPAVLLLDNIRLEAAPALQPVRSFLQTVPAGSLVIAVVNGSHVLGSGSRLPIEELEPGDVRALIDQTSQRLGIAISGMADETLVARLQRAVGGNPKLIESFLQSVALSPAPIEDLLDGLDRGEGLDELFGHIWRELSRAARMVLAACALLRGQAVAEQLRVACDCEHADVTGALAELIRVGLVGVVRGPGRAEIYTSSLAAQRFTLAETSEKEIVSFSKRLAAFYVRQLSAEPENAKWAAPHITGIKAVLQSLYDNGDDAGVQELFASVLDVLFTLGLFDDRIVTGWLAYESAMRADNFRAASLASDVLSSTHAARGEDKLAREALALGLLAAEQSQDAGEKARQMRAHGLVLYKAGEAARALQAMNGADALARETGDLEIVVNLIGVRTVAHWYLGELDAAQAVASEGLEVCAEMGWQRATAYPLRNLAEVAANRGEIELAETLLAQAREVAERFDDRRQSARIHLTSARLALFTGKLSRCFAELDKAEGAANDLGLGPDLLELSVIRRAAARARWLPPLRVRYMRGRPLRFTDAPVGGD